MTEPDPVGQVEPPGSDGRGALPLPTPPLADELVRVRAWRAPDDLAAVRAATDDPRIPAMSSLPARYDEVVSRDWMARQHTKRLAGQGLSLAIAEPDTDVAVGLVAVMGIDWSHLRGELGYWTIPSCRGRGLASRAAGLLVGWVWQHLPLVRIDARIATDNVASQRVAEAAGLVREGMLRVSYRIGDAWLDMALYAAVRPGTPRTAWAGIGAPAAEPVPARSGSPAGTPGLTASEHRRRPAAEERSERGSPAGTPGLTASEHRRRPAAEERSERGSPAGTPGGGQ